MKKKFLEIELEVFDCYEDVLLVSATLTGNYDAENLNDWDTW